MDLQHVPRINEEHKDEHHHRDPDDFGAQENKRDDSRAQ